MTTFRIPKSLAEQGMTGRSDFDWAPLPNGEAVWIGTIETVRIRPVSASDEGGPKFVLRPNERTAEVASIQIGDIEPAEEGLSSPGRQKFFDETIILSVDGQSFFEELPEDVNGRLKYAQYHLGNLAHALGLTDEVGEDVTPVENFEELFRATDAETAGGLTGQRVMFRVKRDEFKRRDGTPGLKYELKAFLALP